MNDEKCWKKKESKLNHVILERQKFYFTIIYNLSLNLKKYSQKSIFNRNSKEKLHPTQQPCKSLLLSFSKYRNFIEKKFTATLLTSKEKNTNHSRLCGLFQGPYVDEFKIDDSLTTKNGTTILLLEYDAENMSGAEVIVIRSHFLKNKYLNKPILLTAATFLAVKNNSVSLDSAFKNRTVIEFERYFLKIYC